MNLAVALIPAWVFLTLGTIIARTALDRHAMAADTLAVVFVGVLGIVALRLAVLVRDAMLMFCLRRDRRHLLARFTGGALLALPLAFWLGSRLLRPTRFDGDAAATGFLVLAGVVAGALVLLLADEVPRQRRRVAVLAAALAILGAWANRALFAAQYRELHLVVAIAASVAAAVAGLGVATALSSPLRRGFTFGSGGLLILAIIVVSKTPPPLAPRGSGDRLLAEVPGPGIAGRGPARPAADPALLRALQGPANSPQDRAAVLERAAAQAPRQVLWITVDALRADHCGFLGHSRPTTPHLDRLAECSFVFERARSQGSDSLGSILSAFCGRYPDALNFRRTARGFAPVQEETIAERLRREGF
ncbi:MAG: sulfatase-like hydrolase/transferase, partial [Planctomycetes bacterium]|nr:sulfatase-like hydrolase/transferase [Planctomycetota bacterium]